jgi:hypothetical protein
MAHFENSQSSPTQYDEKIAHQLQEVAHQEVKGENVANMFANAASATGKSRALPNLQHAVLTSIQRRSTR